MAEPRQAQSDDCYAVISFLDRDGGEPRGTVGWREGLEIRVVFTVWDGPSFAAGGTSLAAAFASARTGITRAGFVPQAPQAGSLADLFADATTLRRTPMTRIRALLWLLVITIIVALVISAQAGAAVPEHGKRLPFPNAPYDYRYEGPNFDTRDGSRHAAARIRHEARQRNDSDWRKTALDPVIAILKRADGKVIARYRLEGGHFCDHEDDNCDFDGIFPIVVSAMADEPVLGVVRHVGAHGQRLSILRPLKDRQAPVFEAVADYALSFRLYPDRLDIAIDHALPAGIARTEQVQWPADGPGARQRPVPAASTLPSPPALSGSAAAFEARLRTITSQRNLEEFMALLTQDVLVSFGGNGGKAEFADYWRLDTQKGRARFWATLERLLDHGGWNEPGGKDDDGAAFPERLTFPWFFSAWKEDGDAENVFIVKENALLRAAPAETAPAIARLNQAAVLHGRAEEVDEALDWVGHGWLEVVAPAGGHGFVRQEDVIPLLETRIVALGTQEGWRIEAMVSGD